ncbi:MAG TPA: hypothetical protein EYQ74_08740 [Planctomycetes bacterium]|nr:hypothetical protein [Planctomycetota bacterium]HIK60861.1 hypothetical protein [Planctomycetota bacterium]
MKTGTSTRTWILTGLAFLGAACSSHVTTSGDPAGGSSMESALQDLGLDPTGLTTLLSFSGSHGVFDMSQVECDGGQSAIAMAPSGSDLIVTWDARVTPSHRVRVLSNFTSSDWHTVTTTDGAAPTFTITTATQDTSDAALGGDYLEVTFSGARLVNAGVDDPSNWQLMVAGLAVDMTGTNMTYDAVSGVATFDLGANANLHANFWLSVSGVKSVSDVVADSSPVIGNATGDTQVPTVDSVVQRLDVDEFGRVLEFSFSKPMNPYISISSGSFAVVDHPAAEGYTFVTGVEQQLDPSVLHVTFSRPVAPDFDLIAHSRLTGYHGNPLGANQESFTSTYAPNGFTSVTALTAENAGGDQVLVVLDQAIDPDFASDPARWAMTVDGISVDMASQVYTYDLSAKTLTVGLNFDMRNNDAVVVDAVSQVDVDGQDFTVQASPVNATGDASAPSVLGLVQNRTVDPSGYTVDVSFSEDVHALQGQDPTNYMFSPAASLTSATILADGSTVRVVSSDRIMTPGDVTLSVDADVDDLAGNAMGSISGPHFPSSTDQTAPAGLNFFANALEGADNDTLDVVFNDDMVVSEVMNLSNWSFESPVGTPLDVSACSVTYDAVARRALVTLDSASLFLKQGDSVQVAFVRMRDIGGNVVDGASLAGTLTSEFNLPGMGTAWRSDAPNDNVVTVRFTEACDQLEDLYDAFSNPYGIRYALRASGVLRGYPTSATSFDGGLGAQLTYAFPVNLTDTLDVIGATDLTGNLMFPCMGTPISMADASGPGLGAAPVATAVSGENNDTIVVNFSAPMAPWGVTDPSQYTIKTNPGGVEIDLSSAEFAWDGASILTITLTQALGQELRAAQFYDVTMNLLGDPLRSAQGIALSAPDTQMVSVGGDVTNGPSQAASSARLNKLDPSSLMVTFDEAVYSSAVELAASYDLGPGLLADSVTLVSPSVARVSFSTPVTAGMSLVISQASAEDLAGNTAVGDMTLLVLDDSTAPTLVSVAGVSVEGLGGDEVHVVFNEPLDITMAIDPLRYAISNGSFTVNMSAVTARWNSLNHTIALVLPEGMELDPASALSVTVGNVADCAGNLPGAPLTAGGSVTGDVTAPDMDVAWTHYALDNAGTTVEVLFNEDVDSLFCGDETNWSTTGAASVSSVTVLSADHVRLSLSQALQVGDSLVLAAGQQDVARNQAGTLQAQPIDPQD